MSGFVRLYTYSLIKVLVKNKEIEFIIERFEGFIVGLKCRLDS
jgi:hypothetical protein